MLCLVKQMSCMELFKPDILFMFWNSDPMELFPTHANLRIRIADVRAAHPVLNDSGSDFSPV